MKNQKVLIVGGVAGGATAAARLRRLDEHAEIILFERGEYISFANCGLPYYIGGAITQRSALLLQTPQSFHARYNVDVRVQHEVLSLNREEKTVDVKNLQTGEIYTQAYDKLLLSPGAKPILPAFPGLDSPGVFTLRNIPDTDRIQRFIAEKQPKTAVIVGGGYIGVEMAENLRQAGLAVTIVEMQNQVIAPLDYDSAALVHSHLTRHGVHLLLETALQGITAEENTLQVHVSQGQLKTDMVILAIGVTPENDLARNAGLQCSARGAIVTDNQMRTSDPDIYAAGDAVEVTDFVTGQKAMIPLAGPANKQGRIAADNICGMESRYGGTQGSAVLKLFNLTVATTGITEKTAKMLGLHYDKLFTFSASHATYYPGAESMSVKTIFDPDTGKLYGAQLVGGAGTDKRCDVLATAIRLGATVRDLTQLELCYAPPYSSAKDPVNMIGYAAENILNKKVKQFHWHEVADLPRDGSVTLLDTRTQMEYQAGCIPGFCNIPLDELRQRLHELNPQKPVYVTCQVGLRGYVACRILSQNGFDCFNLGGGYRLYQSIFGIQEGASSCHG